MNNYSRIINQMKEKITNFSKKMLLVNGFKTKIS